MEGLTADDGTAKLPAGIKCRRKLLCDPCGACRYNDARNMNQIEENRMKKRLLFVGVALLLGTGYTLTAFAQVKPDVLVKQRQAVMILHGKYFYGHLRPIAQGKIPYDANRAATAAGFLEALSRMPWDSFAPSTKDVKSGALPAVFSDTAKFKGAQDRYQSETAKLVSVIKSGDEAATKAQIGAVGQACDGCHENFRQRQ
jgi:cytochrome c556